jgi:acyl carrier protein
MNNLVVIRELAAKQFGGDADSIDPDLPVDQLGIDSLGFLEFLFELEDEVGFPIPQKDVEGIKTLRELASVIDELSAAAKPPATA